MTTSRNKSTAPRADRAFRFYKGGVSDANEFFPGAGTRLHYASQAVDTLTLASIPAGMLAASDSVCVTYKGVCVFRGTVEQIIDKAGRGGSRVNDVTCQGPWGRMQRLVFRQTWGVGSRQFTSSRVILGQSVTGAPYTQREQLREIVSYGSGKCGYQYAESNVQGEAIYLPKDETRDVTVAAAIQRELRFFPKTIVRFDYSEPQPMIKIGVPSAQTDAAYVASIPKTARQYEYNAHPISGVYIYTEDGMIETTDNPLNESAQKYPPDADPNALDCLTAYIPLAKGSSSASYASMTSDGENIGEQYTSAGWWKLRHPRLAKVAAGNITITGAQRSDSSYNYIASNTSEEIAAAGLHSAVCRFSATAKIDAGDDVEERVYLTMDYLTTDAVPGQKYTWQTGSSSTGGETLPEGLAEAIFRQRSGALKNETMTVLLGASLPTLGDRCDGLYLQDFDVDCDTRTANLHFGQPEYLSVDDMRGLLSGFRARSFASNSPARMGMGGSGEEDEQTFETCIRPLSSSEFCPGTKIKTKIGSSEAGGFFNLDPSSLNGSTLSPHTLTIEESGNSYKILAESDITIPKCDCEPSGGGGDTPSPGTDGPGTSGGAGDGVTVIGTDGTQVTGPIGTIQLASAADANVVATPALTDGVLTLTIGVYYK